LIIKTRQNAQKVGGMARTSEANRTLTAAGGAPVDDHEATQRLSQIATRWSKIFQAHQGEKDAAGAAQKVLMERYGGAVYRYLLASLRDADLADELAQEFAYRFLRGDFRRADPQRGRFRDFVKTAVLNLIVDHHRRKKTRPQPLPTDELNAAAPVQGPEDLDRQFVESWRNELLTRTWEALARVEGQTGQPCHTVLRFRADHPELRSAQLAAQLTEQLGKPVTANWVRQMLLRARTKFADLLLDEVAASLDDATTEQVQQELMDLGLLDYCQPALLRRDQTLR
jgi:RNA polymerase sigma-70 factor (ECF subfamily)